MNAPLHPRNGRLTRRVQQAVRRRTGLLLLFALPLLCFRTFAQTRLEEYALILQDPPLARQMAARARIEAAQQQLRGELARRKIRVSGSAETLLNAVFVRVPRDRVTELRSLAGVRRVVRLPRLKRNLNVAVNLVNVPTAWNALPGGMANAGAGVKIAIIDSGIDETHPAFQDASLQPPPGYPMGQTAYTNGKIVVARSYEPIFFLPDDTTPRDRSGHGTALAMIAAGETNTGLLATITGVAPKAWLGNYKIFGTPGVNDNTTYAAAIQALEDAVADHMDIAVVAFGSLPLNGPLDTDCTQSGVPSAYVDDCDISAQAVENAVAMGMTVIAAAGNDAQDGYQTEALNSIDSPGTAPSAITVGAITNAHILFAAATVNGPNVPSNLQIMDAAAGDGVKLTGPLTAVLENVTAVDPTGLACAALPGGSLTGAIVLIERGNCDFSNKINYAQQAGAIGVLLYQDPSHPTDPPFSALGAENTGIPAMMIYYAAGAALQSYLATNSASDSDVQATLNPALHVENALPNLVSAFTSRGPSIDYSIKPELVAVGEGIYTATESLDPVGDLYDPTGYTTVEGSSFAAAMVAGAAALVKQANPGFSAAQIKSALVNTASVNPNGIADDSGSGELLITSVGAGKLSAPEALSPGGTAQPATASFGWVGPGSAPSLLPLTVTNTGKTAATFRISVAPDPAAPDLDSSDVVGVSTGSLQLNAGQQATLNVSLQGGFTVPGIYDGVIDIAGPGANLRVPYWYLESDGVPFDILPLYDSNFFGTAGDTCWYLAFKVVDQYGIAVPNQSSAFSVAQGSGAQSTSSSCPAGIPPGPVAETNIYGVAWTNFDLGSSPGQEIFEGEAGGLTTSFYAEVRPAPSISANGVVDAASDQVGKGLAPGSYISIYGTALSDATQTLSTNFLPFSMCGVSVSFTSPDGTEAWPGRLWYMSPTQINLQIPWGLEGLTSAQLTVNVADVSVPYTIPIAPYLPALFTYGDRLAIAQDRNYQLVTAANPARPGQDIVIYANGLGAVNNPPPSGEVTPSQPLATTLVSPTVTIGGVGAQVLFSGLTPGSIGLYQIDVVVPKNAPAGIDPVVIAQNGVNSSPANLPVQ